MGTQKDSSQLGEDEKAALKRLRKENRELRTEKEIKKYHLFREGKSMRFIFIEENEHAFEVSVEMWMEM